MPNTASTPIDTTRPPSRRWLLGVEPLFEGGWLHRGRRALVWDVEDELIAISILGDVVADLAQARSLPRDLVVKAFAIGRDVEVIVDDDMQVAVTRRAGGGDAVSDLLSTDQDRGSQIVRVQAHEGLGKVSIRHR